jgi:hypothetical protein
MPNWVYNGLTIEGKTESVKSLIEQMNKPFVDYIEPLGDLSFGIKQRKYINPIFSFRNIIAPTDLVAYKKQPEFKAEGEQNDWYSWNTRNWGVKWDVAVSEDDKYPNTNIEEAANGENYVVHYNFETAWGVPQPAIKLLSSQYPDLLFTLSYEEETGWGGEMEFLRGEMISNSEYDSMCRDCDATDCMEYCENDCGQICTVCNWLGEADLESVAECQTHKIYLDTKVPEYRKAPANANN